METSLHPLAWFVVGLSLVAMLGIGYVFARRQRTTDDYFLAGRRMPWLAVGLSSFATLTSTITYLAIPGEMIRNGAGYLMQQVSVPLVLLFLWFVTLPFVMSLRVTSAYEYLEQQFDRSTRRLAAGVFLLITMGWMASVIYTASDALASMTGAPLAIVIPLVGGIAIAYTAMGGIRADIWSDVAQGAIMLVGAIATVGAIALATGTGLREWWADAASVRRPPTPFFSLDPTVRVSGVGVALNLFVWNICAFSGSQVAMQRFFALPDLRAARASALLHAVVGLVQHLLLALCGLALFSFYLHRPELLGSPLDAQTAAGADRIFPRFIAQQLPPLLSGLVVAALFAAAMSTLDSGVNSLAAVMLIDFEKTAARPRKPTDDLPRARRLTVGFGIVVTAVALGLAQLKALNPDVNLIDLLPAAFNWGLGPLGAVFLAGMWFRRCGARGANVGLLLGCAVGFGCALLKPVWGIPFSFAWVVPYAAGTMLLVAALSALMAPRCA